MLSRTARKCIELIEQIEFKPKKYVAENIGFVKTCIQMEIETNEHRRKSIDKSKEAKK